MFPRGFKCWSEARKVVGNKVWEHDKAFLIDVSDALVNVPASEMQSKAKEDELNSPGMDPL